MFFHAAPRRKVARSRERRDWAKVQKKYRWDMLARESEQFREEAPAVVGPTEGSSAETPAIRTANYKIFPEV
jgi:hypothetical protein